MYTSKFLIYQILVSPQQLIHAPIYFASSSHNSFALPLLNLSFNNMNDREDRVDNPRCGSHPKEAIIGVCSLCLKERLLDLASKGSTTSRSFGPVTSRRRSVITLPKVFASISSLHHQESEEGSYRSSVASLDESESFISIKFEEEENGRQALAASKGVVEQYGKTRGTLRWQRRARQLLQLARWKRSSKAEGGGWMRSLITRRRKNKAGQQ